MSMTETRHPEVTVQLTGQDGNAFAIIGRVASALREEISPTVSAEFTTEAMNSGSYDELLRTAMRWVTVE